MCSVLSAASINPINGLTGSNRSHWCRLCRHWLFMAALLVLTACASRPEWPETTRENALPESQFLSQVPFHAQEKYQCGPAALAMMLNSQSLPQQPEELVDRVYIPERGGTLQVELVAAAREQGLIVYPLPREPEAIIAEVAAGNPVLVMQNLGFGWWPQWHYAVVVGYDQPSEQFILHTDTRRANQQLLPVFMRTWDRAERWAVVMLDPGELAATAEPLSWLRAASDLEQTGQTQSAYRAYQAALKRWPEQPAARFGLANSAATLGQDALAIQHLLTLTQEHPQLAAAWHNLGFMLTRAQCPLGAKAAQQCAAARDQRFAGGQTPPPESHQALPACPLIACP
ncbi:MAG: bacteriocin-processing peptidase family protein [Halomonadaceae bacterium]|nr:MAG: bacteriocin-processing peptidase family protein [Halomonadaceae bacterium]